jgi:lambda family phage portal protein
LKSKGDITKYQKRQFEGTNTSRLFRDWVSAPMTIDQDLQNSLQQLRSRSRDLSQNNDYISRYLRLLQINVIGPHGILFQSQARDNNKHLDVIGNKQINDAWIGFSKRGVLTADGKSSMLDVENVIITTLARDGEVFIRKLKGWDKNQYGYAIQLIEADLIDITKNKKLANGNKITMGIEADEWGRPVHYHVKSGTKTLLIPAEEIIHVFDPERIDQSRGYPWTTSSMKALKQLAGYQESELVAARVGAAKMGFITSETGDDYVGTGDDYVSMDVAPGTFEQLPQGMSIQSFDVDHPNAGYGSFTKSILRSVASGLNVSYSALTGDLESTSYSSARIGVLEDRDYYKKLQKLIIDKFLQPLYEDFLLHILGSNVQIPQSKYDKFATPSWRPRGFPTIDELKSSRANISLIQAGLTTTADVLAEQGKDLDEVYNQIALEQELAKQLGLNLRSVLEVDEEGTDSGKSTVSTTKETKE